MTAVYEEHPAPAALAAHVDCVWRFEGADAGEPQRIAPDGRAELIVHYGEPYLELAADGARRQPRALVAGQLTRPLLLGAGEWTGVIGVRFKPAGAWAFVGQSMAGLTDRRMDLSALHPAAPVGALIAAMLGAGDAEARLRIAADYVARQIALRPDWRDPAVERVVERLEAADGAVALETLTRDAGLGARRLQRRFAEVIGVSPRTLAAVLRFRRVFEALRSATPATWSAAAQAAGYFDHPQMARDFQRFVGCSASQFVGAEAGLATGLVDLPADGCRVRTSRGAASQAQ